MASDFKPNIYPIMYWGLMYGLIAGFILFVISLLSQYITVIWFPVFLAGLVWGGYRNYQKQKRSAGQPAKPGTPVEEFKSAAKDIMVATQEMMAEQAAERAEEEAREDEDAAPASVTEQSTVDQPLPPAAPPPTMPPVRGAPEPRDQSDRPLPPGNPPAG